MHTARLALCLGLLGAAPASAQVSLEPTEATDPRLVTAIAAELAVARASEAGRTTRVALRALDERRVRVSIRRPGARARTVELDASDVEVAALTIASLVGEAPAESGAHRATAPAARGLDAPDGAPPTPAAECTEAPPPRARPTLILEVGGSTAVAANGFEVGAGGFPAPRLALRAHFRFLHMWALDRLFMQAAASLGWVDETDGDRFEAGGELGLLVHDLHGNGSAELGFTHGAFAGVTGPVAEGLRFGVRFNLSAIAVLTGSALQLYPGGLVSLLFQVEP